MWRRVATRPKGTTSTGSGKAPSRGTSFDASAITAMLARGGRDDLLAQQRAAAALDQPELADRSRRRRRRSDRARACRRVSSSGCRDRSPGRASPPTSRRSGPSKSGRDLLAQKVDEMARGRAGPEPEPHAWLDEIERLSGRLSLQTFAVFVRGHVSCPSSAFAIPAPGGGETAAEKYAARPIPDARAALPGRESMAIGGGRRSSRSLRSSGRPRARPRTCAGRWSAR